MIITLILVALALWGVSLKWLVVYGCWSAGGAANMLIVLTAKRLDLRCSYIEQLCVDMERRRDVPQI